MFTCQIGHIFRRRAEGNSALFPVSIPKHGPHHRELTYKVSLGAVSVPLQGPTAKELNVGMKTLDPARRTAETWLCHVTTTLGSNSPEENLEGGI